jgi:hypothetical protein
MAKIFLSYRRNDSADAAGRIYDRLEACFGRDNVFMDVDTIPFGVDFRKHLRSAVNQCGVTGGHRRPMADCRLRGGPPQGPGGAVARNVAQRVRRLALLAPASRNTPPIRPGL